MNFTEKLKAAWEANQTLVCVGLDPDAERIPASVRGSKHPYFEFCRHIVDATAPYVCSFKPQFAHFAAVGREDELGMVLTYIAEHYPGHVTILDAKRGDIGSTAQFYAQEAYVRYAADAVTVNPFFGYDSIAPYLEFDGKGVVLLCRTSNAHSDWIQNDPTHATPVFKKIAQAAVEWNTDGQFALVTGATYPQELAAIRDVIGDMPLLVPGIGAQGGDLGQVLEAGLDQRSQGLMISSSRNIIYAVESAQSDDFAQAAGEAAKMLTDEINALRT